MKNNTKSKKKLEIELRQAYRNSIWRDLVSKYGAIPQHMKDEVDKAIRQTEKDGFVEPK